MDWPRSPTSPVTAQLISRRWKIVSFWCYANTQQRSNEGLFKNTRAYGSAVLFQTRPSFIYGVEEPFRLDVMQPCKNIQAHGWAAFSNIPCHGPAHFAALKNRFALMLCRHSTTFKWTDVRASPNTVQLISRCWRLFSSGWYEVF